MQNLQRDLQAAISSGGSIDNATASLLLPTQTLLNVPRTPGADGIPVSDELNYLLKSTCSQSIFPFQTGRARKCSIVQEEEDDEDECSGSELSNPLNRRGSRSEGRLNIAVQDRIAESDRMKKETTCTAAPLSIPAAVSHAPSMVTKKVDGISGVKILTGENCDPKLRLGPQHRPMNLFRRHDVPTIGNVMLCGSAASPGSAKESRSNSIDNNNLQLHGAYNLAADSIVLTKVITDSATITLPLKGTGALAGSSILDEDDVQFPKFKTMPSPTKNNTILNEIYEEGTDIGSSDTSATTTPRPITRHSQFTNVRTQSQGPVQRRSKFNKTRTASCSSSDASDDDSENRKKRAHKIVDSAGKRFGQRRDSYDDSSDSQEPSNLATGGGGATGGAEVGENRSSGGGQEKDSSTTNGSSNGHVGGSTKGQQQMGFRRNRAGRRKAGETRLRESQSLNRITEVQEDISLVSHQVPQTTVQSQQAPLAQSEITDSRVPSPESPLLPTTEEQVAPPAAAAAPQTVTEKKPKGFSARLLQGFKSRSNKQDVDGQQNAELNKSMKENSCGDSQGKFGGDGATTTTRKLKMIGKYFQVSGIIVLLRFCLC